MEKKPADVSGEPLTEAVLLPEEEADEPTQRGGLVHVESVPPPQGGRVFTTRNKLLYTVLSLVGLGVLFGGIGAVLGGITLLVPGEDGAASQYPVAGSVLIFLGVLILPVGGWMCLWDMTRFPRRGYERKIREALADRPDRLIAPDEAEAVFVKYTPRHQWHQIKLDDAADVGLLLPDPQTGMLIFEGDHFRIQIGAEAITKVDVEFGGNGNEPFYLVVVQAVDESGTLTEFCFEYDQLRGMLTRARGQRQALHLQERIVTFLQLPEQATDGPAPPSHAAPPPSAV